MASLNPLTGNLGKRFAAHLLRRTTFGATRAKIDSYTTKTVSQAITELTSTTAINTKPIDHLTSQTWVDNFRVDNVNSEDFLLKQYVVSWWLDNARRDETILHKMMLFLHQNWVSTYENVTSEHQYDYMKLLEYYALGNYKALANKMTLDNSMLQYLNGTDNSKNSPNQNYAREFLELFTIGKGPQIAPGNYTNYTELDVQQGAKLLTGFKMRWADNTVKDVDTGIRSGRPETWDHDTGNKTFSSAFNSTVITGQSTEAGMRQELTNFVNMVFAQAETAKNICRKLYRFFVFPDISAEVETDIITPLATELKANNYVLKPTIIKLLSSQHFFDKDDANANDENIGSMIKCPAGLLIGTMRFYSIQPPSATAQTKEHYEYFWKDTAQDFFMDGCGMLPFFPPNVAGYRPYYQQPDYDKLWFNASTLITRYNFPDMLLTNKRILTWGDFYAQLNIVDWVKQPANCSDAGDGNAVVKEMVNYLLPEEPVGDRYTYFLNTLLGNLSLINWRNEWSSYLQTNNSSAVKPQLEKLFRAIIYSQEYQCF
jgi:uncharacterized protein (DUF1800 family)